MQPHAETTISGHEAESVSAKIMRRLSWEGMDDGKHHIQDAHEDTFNWVFGTYNSLAPYNDEASSLREWLKSGTGIYWVSGTPGSGKSTLMKYVRQHPTTIELLSAWSSPRSCICLDFFFRYAGSPVQKSIQGLLRSLLYQILEAAPELAAVAFPAEANPAGHALGGPGRGGLSRAVQAADLLMNSEKRSEKELSLSLPHVTVHRDAEEQWTTPQLTGAFFRLLTCEELRTNFCIFVDALDEYEGDPVELVDLLKRASRHSLRTKLCVSSRAWNLFEDAFVSAPRLRVDTLTQRDIWDFVQSSLRSHPGAQRLSQTDTKAWEGLLDDITSRASGVFLWVVLVVRSIRHGLEQGDTVEELRGQLETLPDDLQTCFRAVLRSVDPFYRAAMSKYLRIALRADGPLPWMLYSILDDELERPELLIPKALDAVPLPAARIKAMYERVQRRLRSTCQGLLEMSLGPSDQVTYFSPRVEFFHGTARDFLLFEPAQHDLFGGLEFSPGRAIREGYVQFILALPVELDDHSAPLREMFIDAIQYADEKDKTQSDMEDGAVIEVFKAVKAVVENSDSRRGNIVRHGVTSAVAHLRASGRTVNVEEIWESGGWSEEFKPWPEPDRYGASTEPLPGAQMGDGLESRDLMDHLLQASASTRPVRVAVLDTGPGTFMGKSSEGSPAAEARIYKVVGAPAVTSDSRQDWEDTSTEGSDRSNAECADNTSSANPRYAESIFSGAISGTTALSDPASDYVKPAREVLVEFFLEDAELYPLLTSAAADGNIGIDRLSRNFGRLLDAYSLELLGAAINPLQREAAKFVRTSSPYVTRALETRLDSYSIGSKRRPEPGEATELRLMVEERVNAFLESLPNLDSSAPGSALMPNKEDHSRRSEDAQEENRYPIDEAFDEDNIVNALAQVKQFLGTGIPIQNLRRGLRRFVLPSSGDADRIEAPENPAPVQDQTSPRQEAAEISTLQACVPVFRSLPELVDRLFDRLGKTREPHLREGLTRARWKCRCGTQLFDDFTELVPGSIQELEAQLESEDDARQESSISAVGELFGSALNSLLRGAAGRLPRQLKPASTSSGSIIPLHNVGQASPVAPPEEDKSHLLLCIDTGNQTMLQQKRIEQISTDRELFFFLRELYCNYRMPRTWFTLRSIRFLSMSNFTVDFSNSVDAGEHYIDCNGSCVCLPPEAKIGPEYECDPAPRTKPKKNPPIGRNRLTHYFRNPGCIDEKQTTIYDQLPKRVCGELRATSKQEAEGWGIHFEEGWHWRTIFVVTAVFLLSFSLVFGIVWSVTRSDIQGAFAISSFWLSFGGILLGFLAVRSR
ncbi:hypothetical protein QBC47DRAFT_412508 [Echria macrotheca]|uniref:Orc1-like AAA ATPase domain-containing protein n=1 Tax=Echria macrotheca TaxID=438768 RepID=A0AAJ0BHB0_9PEZI|nr:hypothetical protein QBC47DRAFT_412508 [Echria macrotheca]